MWSDWLADTLNRSDPAPRGTPVQRALLSDDRRSDVGAQRRPENLDWEAVTGLLIHEGFGAGCPDA
jgi:hypothetical protein